MMCLPRRVMRVITLVRVWSRSCRRRVLLPPSRSVGVGSVYRCGEVKLSRVVAVKVVVAGHVADRARFVRAQHAMALLLTGPQGITFVAQEQRWLRPTLAPGGSGG